MSNRTLLVASVLFLAAFPAYGYELTMVKYGNHVTSSDPHYGLFVDGANTLDGYGNGKSFVFTSGSFHLYNSFGNNINSVGYSGTGIGSGTIQVGSTNNTSIDRSFSLPDGFYTFSYTFSLNYAGSGSTEQGTYSSRPFYVTIDTTAPIVSLSGVSSSKWLKNQSVVVSASDTNLTSFAVIKPDGTSVALAAGGSSYGFPVTGTYTFRATDVVGHVTSSSVTVSVDNTAPVITSVVNPGGWHSGTVGIDVTASDTESGVTQLYASEVSSTGPWMTVGQESAGTASLTRTFTKTFGGTVWFKVTDASGTMSAVTSGYDVQIDNQAPGVVTAPTLGVVSALVNGEPRWSVLNATWPAVVDLPSGLVNQGGVKNYKVYETATGTFGDLATQTTVETATSFALPADDSSRGNPLTYGVKVIAVDTLDNALPPNSPGIPSSSLTLPRRVMISTPPTVALNSQTNDIDVTLRLNITADERSNYGTLEIQRRLGGEAGFTTVTGGTFDQSSGQVIFKETLGKELGVGNRGVEYKVYSTLLGSTEKDFGNFVSTTLPNHAGSITTLGLVDSAGNSLGSGTPVYITTESPRLRVQGFDWDPDTWQMQLSQNGVASGNLLDYTPPAVTDIPLALPQEGNFTFQVSWVEAGVLQPASPVVQATYDKTPPSISVLQAQRTSDGNVLSQTVGSSVDSVTLKLSASDALAGLASYDLWTVSGALATLPTTVPASVLHVNVAATGIVSPFTFDTATYLTGQAVDGVRTIVTRVVDKAGNAKFAMISVLIKKLATPPPVASSFQSSWTGTTLTLSWGAVSGAVGYQVKRSWGTSTATVSGNQNTTNSYTLDTSNTTNYPGNTPIVFEVKTLDQAGVLSSTSSTVTVRTPVVLGTIGTTTPGYSASLGNYFDIAYSGGSTGTITLVREGTSTATLTLVNGQFRDTQLPAHAVVKYHLVGTNGDGVSVLGAQFTLTVPNQNPSQPSLSGPTDAGWLGPLQNLQWTASADTDGAGDVLTYRLFIKKTTDAAYPVTPAVTTSNTTVTTPSGLVDGTSYEWKVVVVDNQTPAGTNGSTVRTFTYDSAPPSAAWVPGIELLGGYSKGDLVHVEGTDEGSGLQSAIAKTYLGSSAGAPSTLKTTTTLATNVSEWDLGWPTTSGYYKIEVILTDKAGNEKIIDTGKILFDKTAPVVVSTVLDAPLNGTTRGLSQPVAYFTTLQAKDDPETASTTKTFSGIKTLSAQFISEPGGEPVGAWQDYTAPSSSGVTSLVDWGHAAKSVDVPAGSYKLRYLLTDRAGNQTATTGTRVYVVDFTQPEVELTVNGLVSTNGRSYLGASSSLSVALTATDAESGILKKEYGVGMGDDAPQTWSTSFTTAKAAVTFADGTSYRVWSRVTNGVSAQKLNKSVAFLFDGSAPENTTVTLDRSALWTGDSLRITAAADDQQSGVKEYQVQIGTAASAKSISSLVPGNVSGVLILAAGQPVMNLVIPSSVVPTDATHSYLVKLTSVNGANKTTSVSTALTINPVATKPPVSVTDNGPYATVLRASFATTLANLDHYEYRLWKNGVAGASWAKLGAGLGSLLVQSALESGAQYQIEVAGFLTSASTNPTASQMSSGVTIDQGLPSWTSATTPNYADGTTLPISWQIAPSLSGIARITLVATLGGTTITSTLPPLVSMTDYPLAFSNAAFADGSIVGLKLEMENNAGSVVQKELPPVVIDSSPPPSPVVVDQGAFIKGTQPLEAHWINSSPDVQSGTTYLWALTQTPNDLSTANWAPDTGSHRATAGPIAIEGALEYFVVKAINGVGQESYGFSDGIMIDSTAPNISMVRVTSDAAGNNEVAYVKPNTPIYLSIAAYDLQSGVHKYQSTYGFLDGDTFTPTSGAPIVESTSSAVLTLLPPLVLPAPGTSPLVFKGSVFNGSELSQAGYSAGVYFTSTNPTVNLVRVQKLDGNLLVNWTTDPGVDGAPISSTRVKVTKVGSSSAKLDTTTTQASLTQSLTGWANGNYLVEITAKNMAGLSSTSTEVSKTTFWIDSTAPSAPVLTGLPASGFISASLSFSATSSDAESGLEEWRYRLGTETDPGFVSDGWISSVQSTALNINALIGDSVADGSRVVGEIQVKNKAGLWSTVTQSPAVVVDKTPATISLLVVPSYMKVSTGVTLTGVHLEDLQSGLTSYTLAIKDSQGIVVGTPVTQSLNGVKIKDVPNTTLAATGLVDGAVYTIFVTAANRSGATVAEETSSDIKIDLTSPVLSPVKSAGWGVEPNGTWVVNASAPTLNYSLVEASSTTVTVSGTITAPGGGVTTIGPTVLSSPFTGGVVLPPGTFGVYTVSLTATDAAGNSMAQAVVQKIRYNQAPAVSLNALATTPNKLETLSAVVSDPDGDSFTYLWNFGDGPATSSLANPPHQYHQSPVTAQLSTYSLSLTVTDLYGGQTTVVKQVTVSNSTTGSLFESETWSGARSVTGTVTVPPGMTLTIGPTAAIQFQGNVVDGYDQRLVVEGNLVIQSGAKLMKSSSQSSKWGGILVRKGSTGSPTATLGAVEIRDAEWAITVDTGATAVIAGANLHDNGTALHLSGIADVTVTNTTIVNNQLYGVKEDSGGRPRLTNNTIRLNLKNYYQWDGGILDINEINALTGSNTSIKNSGNVGE